MNSPIEIQSAMSDDKPFGFAVAYGGKPSCSAASPLRVYARLSEEFVNSLLCWLQEYVDDEWDRQMKQDAKSGKLNKLVQHARADIAANRVKTLNEILDDS